MPLPDFSYAATASRPSWVDLPAELRQAIEAQLGGRVTEAKTAGGGFTDGFAAILTTSTGNRTFVKAAALDDPLSADYAREAQVTAALPPGVPTPALRWTTTAAGFLAVGLEAVAGRVPELPWRPADLTAALAAHTAAAAQLRPPPAALRALDLPVLADTIGAAFVHWQPIAAGHAPVPILPGYALRVLPELAALEARLPDVLPPTSVVHVDLRLDNILLDESGRAWICDWSYASLGPAWFDRLTLLLTAYASGYDAETLFEGDVVSGGGGDVASRAQSVSGAPRVSDSSDGDVVSGSRAVSGGAGGSSRERRPDGDALDAALAGLSGYGLVLGSRAGSPGDRLRRAHQLWTGQVALAWLAARRGWE